MSVEPMIFAEAMAEVAEMPRHQCSTFFDHEGKVYVCISNGDGQVYWSRGTSDVVRKLAAALLETCSAAEAMLGQSDLTADVEGVLIPSKFEEVPPAMVDVLSLMVFTTGPIADLFRRAGVYEIPRKCEAEQARVMHHMLVLAGKHGDLWRTIGEQQLAEFTKRIKPAEPPTGNARATDGASVG